MHEKDNYLKTAELSTEQNCNMIDGVPNNTPIPPTPPELQVALTSGQHLSRKADTISNILCFFPLFIFRKR